MILIDAAISKAPTGKPRASGDDPGPLAHAVHVGQ